MSCRPNESIRVDKELADLINQVKGKALLSGRTPPSTAKITRIIAKKMKKEGLLFDEFIRF